MSQLQVVQLGTVDPGSVLGENWETLVKGNPHAGFMQSLHWAEFKRKQGLASIHLGLFEEERLIGGGLFYTAANNKGAGILIAPEGPVLPWRDQLKSRQCLNLLQEAIEKNAGDYKAMAMRFEPRLEMPGPNCIQAYGRAPVDLVPRDTLYLDLGPSEDELLAAMKTKGRYNIRLSQKHSVAVQEFDTPEAINHFYKIIAEAASRDHFSVEPKQFFVELAQTLCPQNICRIFLAGHEGQFLAAAMVIIYGNRATYLYGGICNEKRNLMAGYAVQWAAIQSAKKAGCEIYDFYGYDKFGLPGHAYARFSRFKGQFGGRAVRFVGAHEHFFVDRLADIVIRAVNEVALPAPVNANVLSVSSFVP
ncbi:MAG: peptidoglycan bridge formation glycyltransferase FemA/FemB family protein [Candidatus Obscuribacterales bacterium]|nr:peptidoglycan bridge formation glycyltransferase FemA/FemB family protein [Candidatus Obscuribacterales bacterium]